MGTKKGQVRKTARRAYKTRVRQTGAFSWVSKKMLNRKQAQRPRKNAPRGLVWSHSSPTFDGRGTFTHTYTQKRR